jgi:hypothetical protein
MSATTSKPVVPRLRLDVRVMSLFPIRSLSTAG